MIIVTIYSLEDGDTGFGSQSRIVIEGVPPPQVCIGNYTVRKVLMKNRTRVWRNVYNTASA